MARIVLIISDDLLPANLEGLPGTGAPDSVSVSNGTGDSAAAGASVKREITILARMPSAAESLVEPAAGLQALAEAPKVVLLLERAADALEAARLNVDGVVISSPEIRRFLKCIESVAGGRRWVDPDLRFLLTSPRLNRDCLTIRERQVAEGVIRGLRNKEIARAMGVRESTVKMHLHHIFEKLRIASRIQLALLYSSPADAKGGELEPRASL
jgi:two-component system nitrate/nitrite response regulator NarP